MDKKSFDIVLDEIRKCVLTDQRVKAVEQVHGYFSSEQVIDILKYFSWAEAQIKAVKALQHKMVAIPTTKVANILNCFTFSKDKLVVLELIALNISDAQNYRPVEDMFRTHLSEKKRARRILEQVCKVGCKAPVAMISSCGVIPGNPYPKGKPSQVTGSFPKAPLPLPTSGVPAKKESDDGSTEAKGIAARILGPFKPFPSTYNPHRPVPYPIPPCRPHATIAPSAYNNAGLMSVGGVITARVPPPPYSATPSSAAFSRSASQQNPTSNVPASPSPHSSTPSTPSSQPAPTTPITPVFPGLVPSQNTLTQSPSPSPSVIKGPPLPAASPHMTPNHSGQTTPVQSPFPGLPPTANPTSSVIKSNTPVPGAPPCGTPGPSGGFSPSPFHGASRSGTPSGTPGPPSRCAADPSPLGHSPLSYPAPSDTPGSSSLPAAGPSSQSVIRSYTPSGLGQERSTPIQLQGAIPSPKPSTAQSGQVGAGVIFAGEHLCGGSTRSHSGGSSSPVPSAFKGPSRSATPSLSALMMPNSAALARSLGLGGSPQGSLPSPAPIPGLHGLPPNLGPQSAGSPASHFLSTASSAASTAGPPPPSTVYSGLGPSGTPAVAPFGLGLTTAPSIFPGLPPVPSPAFSGFGGSGPAAVGSPVLSSFMGLPGASTSVATVAPLQAAVVAAAAAGVPSTSPVLPGFASAFSSNFNPALVGQPGLTSGMQAPGGAGFPGLLSFPGVPGFSPSASPAALSGLHNPAVQSALLQAHSASALDAYPPQPNGFPPSYPPTAGAPFPLQPGLHPQLGWQ
ncbi:proline and serine-rich protein 1 isoform X2 [Denticeps clupeoides]|uniref:DUF4476 domain-containing protein n=1 Tax=Denticeps clupeoides TaxID=299321 RepID=A0AAY4ADZ8_9TELE|nr:proline and serine-rich protein 1 isoform X2 [Denticeps clupeoides]